MSNLRIVQTEYSTQSVRTHKGNLSTDATINNVDNVVGIAAPWDIGTSSFGSSLGPSVYQRISHLRILIQSTISSSKLVTYQSYLTRQKFIISRLKSLCFELALLVSEVIQQQNKFAVIGGDHSCAIGTWHGVANALGAENPFGLIWIDAHLDAHTPETSISGNLHGMPLAVLLGYGDESLVNLLAPSPVLKPENVVLIGARNIENEELALLRDLGVRLFFMPEIEKRGLNCILKEAYRTVTTGAKYFGISIDLDALDPSQAPGVNTPEPAGLDVNQLMNAFQYLWKHKLLHQRNSNKKTQYKGFLGVEIAEFNPFNDKDHRTVQVMDCLLKSILPELQIKTDHQKGNLTQGAVK